MSPSFLEIPDVPMEKIMNHLDYIAIQSVRKTCWDLRNFIDDKKSGIGLKQININEISDTAVGLAINVTFLEPPETMYIDLTYEKHENGCRILGKTSDGYKDKTVENLDFMHAVLYDFEVAVNTQKSPFELIIVSAKTFLEKFEESKKSQKPIATERMEIYVESLEHVRQIIQNVDPKHLKSIGIYSLEPSIIIRETVKCESSKNIQNFSHFSLTSIQFENIDVEMLRAIKENFLQFHAYDKYLCVIYDDVVRENLFINAFGTTLKPDEEWDETTGEALDVNWFFSVPENKEKVLNLLKKHDCFEFSFIKKCYVPEGYVIRD